jgi:hypothetical protein
VAAVFFSGFSDMRPRQLPEPLGAQGPPRGWPPDTSVQAVARTDEHFQGFVVDSESSRIGLHADGFAVSRLDTGHFERRATVGRLGKRLRRCDGEDR